MKEKTVAKAEVVAKGEPEAEKCATSKSTEDSAASEMKPGDKSPPSAVAPSSSSSSSTPRNDKLVPLKKRGLESPVEFLTAAAAANPAARSAETGESEAKMAKLDTEAERKEEGVVVSEEVREPLLLVEGHGAGEENMAADVVVGLAIEEPVLREAFILINLPQDKFCLDRILPVRYGTYLPTYGFVPLPTVRKLQVPTYRYCLPGGGFLS